MAARGGSTVQEFIKHCIFSICWLDSDKLLPVTVLAASADNFATLDKNSLIVLQVAGRYFLKVKITLLFNGFSCNLRTSCLLSGKQTII
jgi:hypothetical protein